MYIQTVLGPIEPESLGTTMMHEHTFCDLWEWGGRRDYDGIVDDEELLVEELAMYRTAGGAGVVDLTSEGIGRNPAGLRRVAEATGLQIVMGCGWYRERVYPQFVRDLTANALADRLIAELNHGVDGTGVRPGVIGELGTERFQITALEERVFRAAARAQRATGVAISTHTTHFGDLALEQVALLRDEGVAAERIIVGHLGERRNARDVLAVAATGVFVQIDHVGRPASAGTQREEQRARNVVDVVRGGHLDQVLLSMDICANSQLHWNGGHGYDYLLTTFVPLLYREGLTEPEVRTMLVDNPRRALAY
jgi:phosphotriesterase-related protein